MKQVFQQKVQEKEQKLKQSEEELYARHREMKEALEKQKLDLEDKKRRIEQGRPMTPEKGTVSFHVYILVQVRVRVRVWVQKQCEHLEGGLRSGGASNWYGGQNADMAEKAIRYRQVSGAPPADSYGSCVLCTH